MTEHYDHLHGIDFQVPRGWKSIGWLTSDIGQPFPLSGPGEVYIAPLATPGEIECCGECMSYVRLGGWNAGDLGQMQIIHSKHSPLTKDPDKRKIDGATNTTTTEE